MFLLCLFRQFELYSSILLLYQQVHFVINPAYFAEIMYFHEKVYEQVLKDYTVPSKVIIDISHCEGALDELREPHECPKPGDCDRRGIHGKSIYNRGMKGFLAEQHGFSTWEDYNKIFEWQGKQYHLIDLFLGSANKRRKFTEDGGSQTSPGKGASWYPRGSGMPVYFQVADKEQARQASRKVFTKAKNSNKHIVVGFYPMEGLKLVFDEHGKERHEADYNPSRIDWSRPKVIAREWIKIFGRNERDSS